MKRSSRLWRRRSRSPFPLQFFPKLARIFHPYCGEKQENLLHAAGTVLLFKRLILLDGTRTYASIFTKSTSYCSEQAFQTSTPVIAHGLLLSYYSSCWATHDLSRVSTMKCPGASVREDMHHFQQLLLSLPPRVTTLGAWAFLVRLVHTIRNLSSLANASASKSESSRVMVLKSRNSDCGPRVNATSKPYLQRHFNGHTNQRTHTYSTKAKYDQHDTPSPHPTTTLPHHIKKTFQHLSRHVCSFPCAT